jgi:hypothetical protein
MSRTIMNWTTLSRPSASHLRRSEVTISCPLLFLPWLVLQE